MTVRAYLRVSTVQQLDGFSLAAQRDRAEAWARYQGLNDIQHYEDGGISGKRDDRPALLMLLDDVQPGDTVLVYSLSRLGRGGVLQLLGTIKEIEDKGGRLVSLTESIDTKTPTGRLLLTILAALAEMEVEQTRERQMIGRTQAVKEGYWPQSRLSLPYGYDVDSEGRIVEGKWGWVVRLIFRLAAGGTRYYAITAELNRQGIPSSLGGVWRDVRVRAIILAEYYATGIYYFRQYSHPDEPHTWIPLALPPLITQAEWEAAQRAPSKNHCHRNEERYPLTGLLYCECGAKLSGGTINGKGGKKDYRFYRCHKGGRKGAKLCSVHNQVQVTFSADKVEAAARDALHAALTTPEVVAALQAKSTAREDPYAAERSLLEEKKLKLVDLYLDSLIDRDDYTQRLTRLQKRLAQLEAPQEEITPTVEAEEYAHAAALATLPQWAELAGLLQAEFVVSRDGAEVRKLRIPQD